MWTAFNIKTIEKYTRMGATDDKFIDQNSPTVMHKVWLVFSASIISQQNCPTGKYVSVDVRYKLISPRLFLSL